MSSTVDTTNQPGTDPRRERARSTRRVGRLRATLVGGAALTSLATAGVIAATTGSDATASGGLSTSDATSSTRTSTHSTLASTGSGEPHATSSGS